MKGKRANSMCSIRFEADSFSFRSLRSKGSTALKQKKITKRTAMIGERQRLVSNGSSQNADQQCFRNILQASFQGIFWLGDDNKISPNSSSVDDLSFRSQTKGHNQQRNFLFTCWKVDVLSMGLMVSMDVSWRNRIQCLGSVSWRPLWCEASRNSSSVGNSCPRDIAYFSLLSRAYLFSL